MFALMCMHRCWIIGYEMPGYVYALGPHETLKLTHECASCTLYIWTPRISMPLHADFMSSPRPPTLPFAPRWAFSYNKQHATSS